MEFSNTLPGYDLSSDDKDAPHINSGTQETPPSYSDSDPEAPRVRNVKWTPQRCARYDYILHIVSLIFGATTLVLYSFDLAKSRSYHVKLPVGLAVVDAMSIAFLSLCCGWSLVYLFFSDIHARMSRGELSRKWPTWLDIALHTSLLGMADTTLSMRSGKSSCNRNGPVGGCKASRRAVMIAAGVLMIFTA
jgi:hypothetical protein